MPMAESGLCIGDTLLNRSPFLSVRRLDHSREKNGAKCKAYAENRTPNHDLFFHRPTPCATADPLQTRPRGGQCCRFGNEGAPVPVRHFREERSEAFPILYCITAAGAVPRASLGALTRTPESRADGIF